MASAPAASHVDDRGRPDSSRTRRRVGSEVPRRRIPICRGASSGDGPRHVPRSRSVIGLAIHTGAPTSCMNDPGRRRRHIRPDSDTEVPHARRQDLPPGPTPRTTSTNAAHRWRRNSRRATPWSPWHATTRPRPSQRQSSPSNRSSSATGAETFRSATDQARPRTVRPALQGLLRRARTQVHVTELGRLGSHS